MTMSLGKQVESQIFNLEEEDPNWGPSSPISESVPVTASKGWGSNLISESELSTGQDEGELVLYQQGLQNSHIMNPPRTEQR